MEDIATIPMQLRPRELTSGVLCSVIFRQFTATIRVQKEHVAVPNLEKIILAALDIGRRKGFQGYSGSVPVRCGNGERGRAREPVPSDRPAFRQKAARFSR